MTQTLREAVYGIAVPADLNAGILAACRAEIVRPAAPASGKVVRLLPAVATAAACVTVLGVALYATENMPPEPSYTPPVSGSSSETDTTTSTDAATQTKDDTTDRSTVSGETTTTTTTDTPTQTTGSTTAQTLEPTGSSTTFGTETTTTEQPASTTTTTTNRPHSSTTAAHTTRPTAASGTPSLMTGLHEVASFQEMTVAELEAYYGQKVTPAWLPEGMELRLDPSYPLGIYQKNASLMEANRSAWDRLLNAGIVRDAQVVSDRNQLRFSDFIDGRRELIVHISSAPYPRYDLGDLSRFDESWSVAGGCTAQVAYYSDAAYSDLWCYSALMTSGTAEYYVTAWNLTKEEFAHVLESLVD